MTPERARAWSNHAAIEAANGGRLNAEQVTFALVAALEELEHYRPIVAIGKALVDATSGERRALALEAMFPAIKKLRAGGR